jgi:archaellum component FlaC
MLVRSGQPREHDIDGLRSRATELETTVAERVAAINRMKADLAAFKTRYRHDVGDLHEQLEELELSIAEAELGEISKRVPDAAAGAARTGAHAEPAPRFTSDAVRKLFRDVARTIHPDLANDALTRDRRHALMIEANRAYALGDEERLRWILQAWERSPEAVQGTDPEAERMRLLRRVEQLEEQLEMIASDLEELKDTSLWKLKAMVDEAAAKGKNLVADTVRRLKRDILVARNRLDAMRSHP